MSRFALPAATWWAECLRSEVSLRHGLLGLSTLLAQRLFCHLCVGTTESQGHVSPSRLHSLYFDFWTSLLPLPSVSVHPNNFWDCLLSKPWGLLDCWRKLVQEQACSRLSGERPVEETHSASLGTVYCVTCHAFTQGHGTWVCRRATALPHGCPWKTASESWEPWSPL